MVIGIGGCSNSGKSRLAELICEGYGDKDCRVICQDDYVTDEENLPKYYDHTDWETPESIDIESYIADVKAAIDENKLVICEGLFVFWFDELAELFDRNVYLKLDKNEFLLRKAKDLRWGKEPEWYMRHIYDNHQIYGKIKHENEDDIIIDANPGVFDMDGIMKELKL